MSAILACCMGLMKAGEHIVSSSSIFGATVNLFWILAKFGLETTYVDATDPPHRGVRHRCALGGRARSGRAAGGRQLLLLTGAAAAARPRGGPDRALGDQVPRRAGQGAGRRGPGQEGNRDGG